MIAGNAEVDPIPLTEIFSRHRGKGCGWRDSCQFTVSYVHLSGVPCSIAPPAVRGNHRI